MEQMTQLRYGIPVTFCTQVSDENTGAKQRIIADATSVLTSTATQTTLRYSFNLVSCAQRLAWKRKVKQVGAEDPWRAYTYFVDEKRIVQELKKQQRSLDNSPSHSHLGQ